MSRGCGVVVMALALLSGCMGGSEPTTAPAAPPPPTPIGHAELDVSGTWSGDLDDDGHGLLRMTVAPGADAATAFDAEVTFHGRDGVRTAAARGELTPHGHLVIELDDDASVEAHITDPTTLDYCFAVYGSQPVYSCGRLVHD